jgi:hypothetical protein
MSSFFEKSKDQKYVEDCASEMRITILSDMAKMFFFTVTADQLEDALKYFSETDDSDIFEGRGKCALLEHFERKLPKKYERFITKSWGELLKSKEFGIFSNEVLEYEVLKHVEYGAVIKLEIRQQGTSFSLSK